jgi:hypothetical protein
MKHPEMIENLGRLHPKKDRGHDYGRFQCPFCPKTFTARISSVLLEHTLSCGCRQKRNFKDYLERRVKELMTSQALAALLSERDGGANMRELCSKYGLATKLFPTAIRLAKELTPPCKIYSAEEVNLEILRRAEENFRVLPELRCREPN